VVEYGCAMRREEVEMDGDLFDGRDYVARARSLGPALATAADEIERSRELPASIVSTLIDNGLFRLLQPRSLGGAELDPMTYVRVVEEIARHDASTGLSPGARSGPLS